MLSDDEIAALQSYCGNDHRAINAFLRGEEVGDHSVLRTIAAIDRAISKHPLTTTRQLYRGIGGDAASALRRAGVAPGKVFSDEGYLSTSPLILTARQFAAWPPEGIVLSIRANSGTSALDMAQFSQFPKEDEVLLPRATRLRIVEVDPNLSRIEAEVM